MAQPENVALYAETAGALPGIPTHAYELDAVLATADEFQQDGRTVPFMDQFWPNAEVQAARFTGAQEIFSDQASIDEALAGMDEAYEEECGPPPRRS